MIFDKWLFVDWLIRQKARINKGAEWLSTDMLVILLGVSLVTKDLNPLLAFYPARYVAGFFLVKYGVSQREQEILLKWLNPYMDGKLNGRN